MNDKLDFSSLDPERQDPAAWERRIQAVVARAAAARRWTVARQLSRWARPAVALAAAAALFSWLGLLLTLKPAAPAAEVRDPHVLLSRWAALAEEGEQPTVGTLLTVLGEQ